MAATDGFSESGSDFRTRLQNWLPKIVLAPSFAIMVIFVYGFIAFTIYLSFTGSRMLPSYDWVGWQNYDRLFRIRQWDTSVVNLAIFASLYIVISTIIGLMLAIFLDQKIRGEGVLRPIFLYPMALSFIVTGTAWKWMLDPAIGFEATLQALGVGELQLQLDQGRRDGDLHDRDRRRLAKLGFRDGDVPRRPARDRQRDPEGRADGRRIELEPLSPDRPAAASARLPVGLRHPQPPGDQVL
jgi:hypothetical protein